MITLTHSSSPSITVRVYDHHQYLQFLQRIGLNPGDFEGLNSFTYGSLPEGSHGKFLVKASDIANLSVGELGLALTIVGDEGTFTHYDLQVVSYEYINTPLVGWTLSPVDPKETKLAIIHVKDRWASFNQIIKDDYNRVTTFLPADTANAFEPVVSLLDTISTILSDIAANYQIDGASVSFSISGFPTYKLNNLLFAGSSIPEAIGALADAHFLVAYFSKALVAGGQAVITDAQTTTDLLPTKNSLLYVNYGSEALPEDLRVVFTSQAHNFSKQRTTVLRSYYTNYFDPWGEQEEAITAADDSTLAHNARIQPVGDTFNHYYPFRESGVYGTLDGDQLSICSDLAVNFAKRTLRTLNVTYKDIVDLNPSMTIQKIIYSLTPIGLTTTVQSIPPRKISANPILNNVARGMEYVPPTLAGVVETPSGADPLGGYAPGDNDAEILLPVIGASGPLIIPIRNSASQQMFSAETVGVGFNIHRRRFEFTDRCERVFQYLLLSNWSSGTASARRYSMDGVNSGKTVTLRDPLGVASHKGINDTGYMIYTVEDKFYALPEGGDGGRGQIAYEINSVSTSTDTDYFGLKVASVTILEAPCDEPALLGTTVDVVDHSGCLFNEDNAALVGRYGWANWMITDSVSSEGVTAPCHWAASGLCCVSSEA